MTVYANVCRDYDANSVSELRNTPIPVLHLTCVVKAISFFREGCRLVKSMDKTHTNGVIRWFECEGGTCSWKAKFVKRGVAQEAGDSFPWYLHYEDSHLEHCPECHAPTNEANETMLTQCEILQNSVCLQEYLKQTGNSTKKQQILRMLKREANIDISGIPKSTYYVAMNEIKDFVEREVAEQNQHRDHIDDMETEVHTGDQTEQDDRLLFNDNRHYTSPTRSFTIYTRETSSPADSFVQATETALAREAQRHKNSDNDTCGLVIRASSSSIDRTSTSIPISFRGRSEPTPFPQRLQELWEEPFASESVADETLDVNHLINLQIYDSELQEALLADPIGSQLVGIDAEAASPVLRNAMEDFSGSSLLATFDPPVSVAQSCSRTLYNVLPPVDSMDDEWVCVMQHLPDDSMGDIECQDSVVGYASSGQDLDSFVEALVEEYLDESLDSTTTNSENDSETTDSETDNDSMNDGSDTASDESDDESGGDYPNADVESRGDNDTEGDNHSSTGGEGGDPPAWHPHKDSAYHGGKTMPTTQSIPRSEMGGPLTLVAAPGVGYDGHHNLSGIATKERSHTLPHIQSEPTPPPFPPVGVGFEVSPTTTPDDGEDYTVAPQVPERNQSPIENPSSSNKHSGGFFGKRNLSVGAGVLVVASIILIVVLATATVATLKTSGEGTPATFAPIESPGRPSTGRLPHPPIAPALPTLRPSASPSNAPNPNMPAEIDKPQQPTTPSLTLAPSTNHSTSSLNSQTLEEISMRGFLLCGVAPGLEGFSVFNGETYEGFEADLCRAVAAAALGSTNNVEFVEVELKEMFVALQLGVVDVLASHATHTMERDVFEISAQAGFTFSVPYLYDGLTFGGLPTYTNCTDRLDTTGNCTSLRICALEGSTHASVVEELLEGPQLIRLPTLKSLYDAFDLGLCDVIAGDRFEVSEAAVQRNGYTGEYQVGKNLHSHEPLSLVTKDDDIGWSDMVQWVVQALLTADEQGVFMNTTESFAATELLGDSYTTIFRNAVSAVGNYGELYARHLEMIVPRGSINAINEGDFGLILSHPFGLLARNGQGAMEGGTLRRILERGHLRCGITQSPGFGEVDPATGVWSGFDVDFCRAVSAAIFSGVADEVDFRILNATERFVSLANGDIDLLSRITTWNLQRDVMEPTAGVGFSFSQPTFYDGLALGGIPPYLQCADLLDTISPACQDLRLCVVDGTTTLSVIRSRFPESFLVPQLTQEEVIAGLSNGACNAIGGGVLQISEPSVRKSGYTGPYETGQNILSKDPLSLVTPQDDPRFTSFVNWIVTATFYAEEQGISQSNGTQMPLVSLFGPLYSRMLSDAIQAVGNYGDIYARNLEPLVPRAGRNALNRNPFSPRHYPLPGI